MWINIIEANAHVFEWSDSMIKYQALQKLRNTAKTWLDSLQKNETRWTTWRWKQWRDALSDTFQVKRNMFVLLKQLVEAKPVDNQSLYDFYFQLKGKIDQLQLGFKDSDIISIIVGLIGDINISTAAEAGSFRHGDDLASFLHSKIYKNNPRSSRKHVMQPNQAHSSRQIPNIDLNFNSLSSRKNIQCFRCGEIGHKKFNCTMSGNLKCNLCNRMGHLDVACKSKAKLKDEKDAEVKMIADISAKQKFYKRIILNGFESQAFF